MKNKFIFILLFSIMKLSFSQKLDSTTLLKKNAISLELLGNAGIGYYSVNYERKLFENENGFLTIRTGISKRFADYYFPILINGAFGENNSHFEVGGGMTLAMYRNSAQKKFTINEYDNAATANFIYRFQKPGGKFIFRAGWTPLVYYNWFNGSNALAGAVMLFYLGGSMGYAF